MGLRGRTILGFNRDHGFAKASLKAIGHSQQRHRTQHEGHDEGQNPQNTALGTRLCLARMTCLRILSSLELPSELFQMLCVTFLVVFFSYCRYRDSTTFPPVGTHCWFITEQQWCVRTHTTSPRATCQWPSLTPLRSCPSAPLSMYGTPAVYKNTYGTPTVYKSLGLGKSHRGHRSRGDFGGRTGKGGQTFHRRPSVCSLLSPQLTPHGHDPNCSFPHSLYRLYHTPAPPLLAQEHSPGLFSDTAFPL